MYCKICGNVSEDNDVPHMSSTLHKCNEILYNYKQSKASFTKNRDSILIFGGGLVSDSDGKTIAEPEMTDKAKIFVNMKPTDKAKFIFDIKNEANKEDLFIVGIHLAHPQPQYTMNAHPYVFGGPHHLWRKKTSITEEISVTFAATDIGHYEMPIMFTFLRKSVGKNIIFIREMVVMVEEDPNKHQFIKTPYLNQSILAKYVIPSIAEPDQQNFKVPKSLKILLPIRLEEHALNELMITHEAKEQLRLVLRATRAIFDEGLVKGNYLAYFHHLLWWEEIVIKINLKKYNMSKVKLVLKENNELVLEVPGLAEKRPSLLRGDRVFLQNQTNTDKMFESVIKNIDDTYIHLGDIDERFFSSYSPESVFDVRFIMSRVPMERSHEALARLSAAHRDHKLFPEPRAQSAPRAAPLTSFYNYLIAQNKEQRSAVENIVAGSSGAAPYVVFGPPGTGKTMTIVEAIIQLVVRNPHNRLLVCTDSNMAADHIALKLLRYNGALNISNFLLRANSQSREWSSMPGELAKVSNGTSYDSFRQLSNSYVANFRIVVSTLMHSAKYASNRSQRKHRLQMSHLFVDEAAQSSEPHVLVALSGLLAPAGALVLAGDPRQLGPVCISKETAHRGLGKSLLERLSTYDMYQRDPNYVTMLKKNFRSHPDILKLSNAMFYGNQLEALAPLDPLSSVSILGMTAVEGATVFHAVNSKEQRMGNAPSFFNEKELEMLRRYVTALINNHKVQQEDIGIIAPYIRQVYKMKSWLTSQNYNNIEVGTVEALQGKEKRVVLISTVRANNRLLDYDALYALGFLVDDKRFNVALTRAKAKLVIIGNPTCLINDIKWCAFMRQCKEMGSYFGEENQQLLRTSELLEDIAKKRFDMCGLTQALKLKQEQKDEEARNKYKKNIF